MRQLISENRRSSLSVGYSESIRRLSVPTVCSVGVRDRTAQSPAESSKVVTTSPCMMPDSESPTMLSEFGTRISDAPRSTYTIERLSATDCLACTTFPQCHPGCSRHYNYHSSTAFLLSMCLPFRLPFRGSRKLTTPEAFARQSRARFGVFIVI